MRIKADENIPLRVVELLIDHGRDVDTVAQEQMVGEPDHRELVEERLERQALQRALSAGCGCLTRTAQLSVAWPARCCER